MQLIFFSQCSAIVIKQLIRKGGEASLEAEWRIKKKKNRDMQLELGKQVEREREMSEDSRGRGKRSV